MEDLLKAIEHLPIESTGRLPEPADSVWPDCVLIALRGWARGLNRDIRRATAALAEARLEAGAEPDDDEIASVEECFWRIAAAVEKFDALVAVAFGAEPLRPERDSPRKLEMRPDAERNKKKLREIGGAAMMELIERRSKIGGTRAELRRNQVMHSLAPIASVDDLASFIEVTHRDGSIMVGGYNVVRFSPTRWDEGIKTLAPAELFARRLLEAERALADLEAAVSALASAVDAHGALREPQWIYTDFDTGVRTLERPSPEGRRRSYEVDFTFKREDASSETRRISCESLPRRGDEIPFEDGTWRVIDVDSTDDTDGLDGRATLIPRRS
jgi:hypothetical protein